MQAATVPLRAAASSAASAAGAHASTIVLSPGSAPPRLRTPRATPAIQRAVAAGSRFSRPSTAPAAAMNPDAWSGSAEAPTESRKASAIARDVREIVASAGRSRSCARIAAQPASMVTPWAPSLTAP